MQEGTNRAQVSPSTLLIAGAGLGGLLVALSVGWIVVVRERRLVALFPPDPLGDLLIGFGVGLAFAALQWALFLRVDLLRAEIAQFEQVIDFEALRWHHIAALAMLAAVPEELLFRGALLPDIGWLGAALIFGLAHAISWRYFAYATGAGVVLGLLMVWAGGLWAPITAHAVIDAVILSLLIRRRPPGGW